MSFDPLKYKDSLYQEVKSKKHFNPTLDPYQSFYNHIFQIPINNS